MHNKQALAFINRTDELLNNYGKATTIANPKEQRKVLKRILSGMIKTQSECTHPYLLGSTDLYQDGKMECTCLVCGKTLDSFDKEDVLNLTPDSLIEGDEVENFAVNRLKDYLSAEPALTEDNIKIAVYEDIKGLTKNR